MTSISTTILIFFLRWFLCSLVIFYISYLSEYTCNAYTNETMDEFVLSRNANAKNNRKCSHMLGPKPYLKRCEHKYEHQFCSVLTALTERGPGNRYNLAYDFFEQRKSADSSLSTKLRPLSLVSIRLRERTRLQIEF